MAPLEDAPTCLNGHELQEEVVPYPASCDHCKKNIRGGTRIMRCAQCSWDWCNECDLNLIECPVCKGTGKFGAMTCFQCEGKGRTEKVSIPPPPDPSASAEKPAEDKPEEKPDEVIELRALEGSSQRIEVPEMNGKPAVVNRAYYGDAHKPWNFDRGKDVTERCKSLLADGVTLMADDKLFGDPLPYQTKALVVKFKEDKPPPWLIKDQEEAAKEVPPPPKPLKGTSSRHGKTKFMDGSVPEEEDPDADLDPEEGKYESDEAREEREEKLRVRGNEHFKNKLYERAKNCYTKALGKDAETYGWRTGSTFSVLYCNRSACELELGNAQAAYDDALLAMRANDKNKKAHFRRGRAAMVLEKHREAYDAFVRCRQLAEINNEAPDPNLKRLIVECERHIPKWLRQG